jgi:alpha-L-fucosidase
LHFGVSVHASHAWSWFEVAQGADKDGPYAGIPYDGKLTQADGAGKWWDGLDPQELYSQSHEPSEGYQDQKFLWDQKKWAWGNGVSIPDQAYIDSFAKRTYELVDKYEPDLVCFDDTIMPLHPLSDIGLKLTSHIYNSSIARSGKLEAVVNTKCLETDQQKQSVVWDIERGGSPWLLELPWQTETCIGQWHYADWCFEQHDYKTAEYVIHTLIDIVSKNGNLLLSIPIKGDGTIDSDEVAFLETLAAWITINGKALYGTRPWVICGEGPIADAEAAQTEAANFTEGTPKVRTSEEIRFTTKGDTLFAFVPAWPENREVTIRSLGNSSKLPVGEIVSVSLVGGGELTWSLGEDGLVVQLPQDRPCKHAWAIEIARAVEPS